ncbi:hypothetical protein [Krasilnikovia sp. MM14-A1004]|uniref:hypothetical protein n=1 Tax=Krasilnikovia sp. MM14-A1004 TaxID=3373541 RepID=UPI00399D3523
MDSGRSLRRRHLALIALVLAAGSTSTLIAGAPALADDPGAATRTVAAPAAGEATVAAASTSNKRTLTKGQIARIKKAVNARLTKCSKIRMAHMQVQLLDNCPWGDPADLQSSEARNIRFRNLKRPTLYVTVDADGTIRVTSKTGAVTTVFTAIEDSAATARTETVRVRFRINATVTKLTKKRATVYIADGTIY